MKKSYNIKFNVTPLIDDISEDELITQLRMAILQGCRDCNIRIDLDDEVEIEDEV